MAATRPKSPTIWHNRVTIPYTLGHWLQLYMSESCIGTALMARILRTSLDNAVNPPFAQHPPCLACIQTPAQPVFPSFLRTSRENVVHLGFAQTIGSTMRFYLRLQLPSTRCVIFTSSFVRVLPLSPPEPINEPLLLRRPSLPPY